MKNTFLVFVAFSCLLLPVHAQEKKGQKEGALGDEKEKASYAAGLNIGKACKNSCADYSPDAIVRGFVDAVKGGPVLLTADEAKDALAKYGRELMIQKEQKRKQAGEKNKADGADFLAANKNKKGVVVLPSGLHYMVLREGAGQSPIDTDWVTVKFRGTLLDGTEFDKSDKPTFFSVQAVTRGWSEALQLMKPGAKWRLFVPPDLAFGEDGAPKIGPNATLTYDLELVSVQATQPPPTAEELKFDKEHMDED